jgi:hypothetical protein
MLHESDDKLLLGTPSERPGSRPEDSSNVAPQAVRYPDTVTILD